MRILVMLNPTNRYGTKGTYTELRKFLLCDGYIKLQNEVFMRVEDTKKRLRKTSKSYKIIFTVYRRSKNVDFDREAIQKLRFVSWKARLARKTYRRKRLGNAIKM